MTVSRESRPRRDCVYPAVEPQDARTLPAFAKLGRLDVQARIAQYAALSAGEQPASPRLTLLVPAGGFAALLLPYDGHDPEPEQCTACKGKGGDEEADDDGVYYLHNCTPCMGTGERLWCWSCAHARRVGEPRDDQRAVLEVRVHLDEHTFVSRLVCKRDECLGEVTSHVLERAECMRREREQNAGRSSNGAPVPPRGAARTAGGSTEDDEAPL